MSVEALQTAMYKAVLGLLLDPANGMFSTGDPKKVRPGTVIRRDDPRGTDQPDRPLPNKQPGDFPEVAVLWGPATLAGYEAVQRYGYGDGSKPTGIAQTLVQGFRVTLTHAGIKADLNDPVVAAAMNALNANGPSLGLVPSVVPYAVRGQVSLDTAVGKVTRPISGSVENTPREQVTLSFDVTVRWKGDALPTVIVP